MSLILEALKKLDREKQVPDRGFLVMAATPWPSASRGGTPAVVAGLVLAMAAGAGIAYWLLRPAPPINPGPAAPAVAAIPAAAPPAVIEAPTPPPTPTAMPEATPRETPARVIAPVVPVKTARLPSPPPTPTETPARAAGAPASAPAVPPLAPPFTLEAISLRDGSPIAVINGRLLHEGDVTNGITVVKIGTESVELEIRGVRQIVRF